MNRTKRLYSSVVLSAFVILDAFISVAYAAFPSNPLPDTIKLNNPLRNESGYAYTYHQTDSLATPDPAPVSETFAVDKVRGYRECSNAACHQSYWYKQNGWTISTHGLFGSRAGGSHSGLDIASPIGTDVYAVDAGTVTFQYNNLQVGEGPYRINTGYGLYARVTHNSAQYSGFSTLYAHLTQFTQDSTLIIVAPGTRLARSGASGNATVTWNGSNYGVDAYSANLGGPHLHFEVRDAAGTLQDPLRYLPDAGAPISQLSYVKVMDNNGEAIYSNMNANLTNVIYTQGPATIELGGVFDDNDLLIKSISYMLNYDNTGIGQKVYTLQPIYGTGVSKAIGRYHYLPEWKSVSLVSNFVNQSVGASTLDSDPEVLPVGSPYDINPAAMPNYDFSFNVAVPASDPCNVTNTQKSFHVDLFVTDSQDKGTLIPSFLVIKPLAEGAPPPDCPGNDHPDDNYDVASTSIIDAQPATADKLVRLAVKKNKTATVKSYLLKKELENLERSEEEYYRNQPVLDGEEAITRDLKQVLEITDPTLKEMNARKLQVIRELDGLNKAEKSEFKTIPDLAILANGFSGSLQMMLYKMGEPYTLVETSFSPDIVQNHPVLIVPSAGLYGLNGSSVLKTQLDEYVKVGGTLIVFAQQHGYEFEVLPTPDGKPISGYGWTEDQSCFTNAVYFDTWHQILSGQSWPIPTINVDGYFTSFPSTATVILRRTANGQPALIMYEHGQGRVIVTSMYSDWAFGHGQASAEERSLVRDMITWAKSAVLLPDIKPGETASLLLVVSNTTTTDASYVQLKVLDPAKNVQLTQDISQLVPAGQLISVPFMFASSSASPVGIWQIDYTLLDNHGNIIQSLAETDSGRFVVNNPLSNPFKSPDLNLSVQSASENYFAGSSASFTFHIWNNSGTERNLTVTWGLAHHSFGWDSYFNKAITIPANSHLSFDYILDNVRGTDRLRAKLLDERGMQIGYAERGIWMINPSIYVSSMTNDIRYEAGEEVKIELNIQNKLDIGYPSALQVRVTDPYNDEIFSSTLDINLLADEITTRTLNFYLPSAAKYGFYSVSVDAYLGTRKIGYTRSSFELIKTLLSVTPITPPVFGSNSYITFAIKNNGLLPVSCATLSLSLKDPDGAVIWDSHEQLQSLQAGQTATINVSIPIENPRFGDYSLIYSLNNQGKTQSGGIIIPNTPTVMASFDKSSYSVRETSYLTIAIINGGKFNLDNLSVSVAAPDINYSHSEIETVATAQTSTVKLAIPIPASILPGQHAVAIALTLPTGSEIAKNVVFTVPESLLGIDYTGSDSIIAGDSINLSIKNTGGVDTTYLAEKIAVYDNKGIVVFSGNASGEILAGSAQMLDVQMPAQTLNGPAQLDVQVKDVRTGNHSTYYRQLDIEGPTAQLQSSTNKGVYLKNESLTALSNIANGKFGINGGSLELAVKRMQKSGESSRGFVHFLPNENWFPPFGSYGIAAGSDGSLYVTDSAYDRILRLDKTGKLVSVWGRSGENYGQFNYPMGIAVGPDGSVYVADTGNNRIQKFDAFGNFIAAWGTSGWLNGQFDTPKSVAVSVDGFVYVSDTGHDRVQKFDSNGNFIAIIGDWGWLDGQFMTPEGLCVGVDGSLYVADAGNHRIQKFDSSGNFIMSWGDDNTAYGGLSWIFGLGVGPDGSVYSTDYGAKRILKFDENGNYVTSWDLDGSPYGIAITRDGSIYAEATVEGIDNILKFDNNGNLVTTWESYCQTDSNYDGNPEHLCEGLLYSPYGVAAAPDGSLYVTDSYNSRIQKYDASGNFVSQTGNYCRTDSNWDGISDKECDGKFSWPMGIAVSTDGSVYVTDYDNNLIQKLDANGNFISKWGTRCIVDTNWDGIPDRECKGGFLGPYGIGADQRGFLYVADYINHQIQKFDGNGNFISKWGTRCIADSNWDGIPDKECDGNFYYPSGLAISPEGYIYVSDGNNRIQKFDSDGNFISKLGNYCSTDSDGDGVADQPCDGQFSWPEGVAIDSDGSVYVGDTGNYRIQKFDSNGTFLAKWGEYGSDNGQFVYPGGLAAGSDGSIYAVDNGNNRVQNMALSQPGGIETLFAASLPINQEGDMTQDYLTDIGAVNTTGKLYLQAELKNSLGQTLANVEYPFYIVSGNTILSVATDKKVYRPGEAVTITGEVRNLASVDAVNQTTELGQQRPDGTTETIYAETFSVAAGGNYPFSATTIAVTDGTVVLTGRVTQNNSTLVEIADQFEVASPNISTAISMPEVTGNEPFDINVELQNEGKIAASVGCGVQSAGFEDVQQIRLQPGETKQLQYSQQIASNTEYTFTFSGDLNQTVTKTVAYGLASMMTVSSQTVYPEGKIIVPVTIVNTGQLDASLDVSYELRKNGDMPNVTSKSYYLQLGASISDMLYYDLTEGDYQLMALSSSPTATTNVNFSVRKENVVDMALTVGSQNGELIPVSVNFLNNGYNTIEGNARCEITNENGDVVWNAEQTISQLTTGTSLTMSFNVNPAAMMPGAFTVKMSLLNKSGTQLTARNSSLVIQGATLEDYSAAAISDL